MKKNITNNNINRRTRYKIREKKRDNNKYQEQTRTRQRQTKREKATRQTLSEPPPQGRRGTPKGIINKEDTQPIRTNIRNNNRKVKDKNKSNNRNRVPYRRTGRQQKIDETKVRENPTEAVTPEV